MTYKIFKSFLYKNNNRLEYILMIISLLIWEFGSIFILLWIDNAIYHRNYLNSMQIPSGYTFPIILLFLLFIILNRLLYKHIEFKLSNKGLVYVEADILSHFLKKDYEELMSYDRIELAQKINNDTVIIIDYLISKKIVFIFSTIKAIAILITTYLYAPIIALILLSLSFVFFIIYFSSKKYYEYRRLEMLDSQSQYFKVLGSELLSLFLVKINSWYETSKTKFIKSGNVFYRKSVKFLDLDFFLSNLVNILSTASVFLIPFMLLKSEKVEISNTFLIIILTYMYFPCLEIISESFKHRSCFNVSMNRLIEVLNIPNEQTGSAKLSSVNSITITELDYRYKNMTTNIINNFSITFQKNNIYMIKGSNGCGKSTLLKILLGLLHPQRGQIFLDNHHISTLDIDSLRKNIFSYCEQTPFIIEGSLIENLDIPFEESSLIDNFKDILDFFDFSSTENISNLILNENNLSGGEKQAIAITRCLIKQDRDVYILDEPTSNLDDKKIKAFIELINHLKKDKIIIIVTHDDRLFFDKGNVKYINKLN